MFDICHPERSNVHKIGMQLKKGSLNVVKRQVIHGGLEAQKRCFD